MSSHIRYDLYLSYSGRKTYLTCPEKYRLKYVDKISFPKDLTGSCFGSSIGKLIQWFYEKKIWASPNYLPETLKLIPDAINSVFKESSLDPNNDPYLVNKVTNELKEFVPSSLETIRKYKLLTESSRCEVDLSLVYSHSKYDLTLKLGGRADFIHGSGQQMWILDGKGSTHRETFVDSGQLIWYALLHYLKFKVSPSRLGFIYWRFPDDPLQWIDFDENALRASAVLTFETAKNILNGNFPVKTGPDCKLCEYQSSCVEGRKYVAAHKLASGGRIEDSIFDLEKI